jgi:glutamate racemase
MGGLTVLRALAARLPEEAFVYLGDTARLPYGTKSAETVQAYALQATRHLIDQSVKMVVVACNTASAVALEPLAEALAPVPVIGVIEPGARAAATQGNGRPVGVIGTAGTIASNAYAKAIRRIRADARVEQRACPLFVPLVEEGWFEHPAADLIAREYLAPLSAAGVGSLVLGCTHYPLLRPLLQRVMGSDVRLIDSGEETARVVASVLRERGMEAPEGASVSHRFVVSDDEARFRQVGARFIGDRLDRAEVVPLG